MRWLRCGRGLLTEIIDVEDSAHSRAGSPVLNLGLAGRGWGGIINGGIDLGQRFLHFSGHVGDV